MGAFWKHFKSVIELIGLEGKPKVYISEINLNHCRHILYFNAADLNHGSPTYSFLWLINAKDLFQIGIN